MVRADEDGAVVAAGFADAPSHSSGGLHFQVHVLGASLDCQFQQFRGLGLFVQTAGGDEWLVRVLKQTTDVVLLKGASVQAYFRHLLPLQDFQNLFQLLILYRSTNHFSSFTDLRSRHSPACILVIRRLDRRI